MPYRFGPFVADPERYRLSRGDEPLELTPKLLDLLFHFLAHPSVLVTKEELLERVWPGANVTDNALAQAVSELREALGDQPKDPIYIRTVTRRGYRFVAPVESDGGPSAAELPRAAGRRAVAVLDFQNVTGEPDVAWLSSGVAETVTSDLASLDAFRVVDRWQVVLAADQAGSSMVAVGRAVGADLMVTGSYQRMGPRLRITARLVDLESGEALADAKVDGALDEVFELQDGIVTAFARELDLPVERAADRLGVRETSSLDAYRAYTEGLVKTESLDTGLVRASIADFERAIHFDPAYAMAYTGLANAYFVAYETTRVTDVPDVDALAAGLTHARRAVELDDQLAEAYATLSFLLVSAGDVEAARTAAHRAVVREPDNWRHQYRLGHACWGAARLKALQRALSLYPQFAFAAFESAMVHVARGHLDAAERTTRRRPDERAGAAGTARFPAVGFHWLQGALDAAGGRHEAALASFDREVAGVDPSRLYAPEYAAEALTGRGHVLLATARPHEALASFREAFDQMPGFPRAVIGEALALDRLSRHEAARDAWKRAERVQPALESLGRRHDALLFGALVYVAQGRPERAVAGLDEFLTLVPPSHAGWWLPIEPALAKGRPHDGIDAILRRLAERAR